MPLKVPDLRVIAGTAGCRVYPPHGLPVIAGRWRSQATWPSSTGCAVAWTSMRATSFPSRHRRFESGCRTGVADLLKRLVGNAGRRWYWLDPDLVSLDDAYDQRGGSSVVAALPADDLSQF